MLQTGRLGVAFFRKDQEKIKIFHPLSHVVVVIELEQKRQQQGGCSLSSAPQVSSSASARETGLALVPYTILSRQKFNPGLLSAAGARFSLCEFCILAAGRRTLYS